MKQQQTAPPMARGNCASIRNIRGMTFPRPMGVSMLSKQFWNMGYTPNLPIKEGDYIAVHNADFFDQLEGWNQNISDHPAKAIIGIVRFCGCCQNPFRHGYGWKVSNPVYFEPVCSPGHRGLWKLRPEVLELVRRNYREAVRGEVQP